MTNTVMLGGDESPIEEIPTILVDESYLISWYNAQLISDSDILKLKFGEIINTPLGNLKMKKTIRNNQEQK